MSVNYKKENADSLARLRALTERVSLTELEQRLASGWTVAATLAHMAFWDQRAVLLVRRWRERGVDSSPVDVDVVNDAAKALCHAILPKEAIHLVLESAEAADHEIEGVSPALAEEIEAGATQFHLSRANHRNYHLDEIEAALNGVGY